MANCKITLSSQMKEKLDALKISVDESDEQVVERIVEAYLTQLYKREKSKALSREVRKAMKEQQSNHLLTTQEVMEKIGVELEINSHKVLWTQTALDNLRLIDREIVELIIEKAHRYGPRPDHLPKAWRALDVLNYAVIVDNEENVNNVLTIAKRDGISGEFQPIVA